MACNSIINQGFTCKYKTSLTLFFESKKSVDFALRKVNKYKQIQNASPNSASCLQAWPSQVLLEQ
jgi:hypothetical protein